MKSICSVIGFLLVTLTLVSSFSFAEVYKYSDKEGNTHYVDSPSKIPEEYRSQSELPHKLPNIVKEGQKKVVTRDFQDNPQKKSKAVQAFDQMLAEVTLPAPQQGETDVAKDESGGGRRDRSSVSAPNIPGPGENLGSPKAEDATPQAIPPMLQKLLSGPFLIFLLALLLVYLVSVWRLLSRADMPGYGVLIPIYNIVLLSRLGGFSGWWILWMLVPVVGAPIWGFTVNFGIAKQFDRSTGFAILTAIIPMICLPIIAFSDSD